MKCQIPYAHDSRGQNFVNFRAMCNWMWSKSATWWHWTNKGLKKLENRHKKVLATCCMTSDWWHCPEEKYVCKQEAYGFEKLCISSEPGQTCKEKLPSVQSKQGYRQVSHKYKYGLFLRKLERSENRPHHSKQILQTPKHTS